jgi:hypothetical protein
MYCRRCGRYHLGTVGLTPTSPIKKLGTSSEPVLFDPNKVKGNYPKTIDPAGAKAILDGLGSKSAGQQPPAQTLPMAPSYKQPGPVQATPPYQPAPAPAPVQAEPYQPAPVQAEPAPAYEPAAPAPAYEMPPAEVAQPLPVYDPSQPTWGGGAATTQPAPASRSIVRDVAIAGVTSILAGLLVYALTRPSDN